MAGGALVWGQLKGPRESCLKGLFPATSKDLLLLLVAPSPLQRPDCWP